MFGAVNLHIFLIILSLINIKVVKGNLEDTYKDVLKHMYSRELYHAYTFGSGVGNREDLAVDEFQLDTSFQHIKLVKEWKSLRVNDNLWLVGIQQNSFLLSRMYNLFNNTYKFSYKEVDLKNEIDTAWIFDIKNSTSGQSDVYMTVAVKESNLCTIIWYRVTSNDELIRIWEWPMWNKLSSFTVFNYYNEYNIAFIHESETHQSYLKLYKLSFDNGVPNIVLLQNSPLKYSAMSISVTIEVNDLYLSVVYPSWNRVQIFKYTFFCDEQPEGKLSPHKLIQSKGVTSTIAFSTAGRNYLAINGEQADIYKFDRNGKIEPYLKINLGKVEDWLVMNVGTYRNDVVILVKHNSNVKILTWAGNLDGFVIKESPTCYRVDKGLKKLSIESKDLSFVGNLSWKGVGYVEIGDVPSIIFPNIGGASQLFHVIAQLKPLMNPEWDILRLEYNKNKLQEHWESLKIKLKELGFGIDTNEREGITNKIDSEDSTKQLIEDDFWPSLDILEDHLVQVVDHMDEFEKDINNCENENINARLTEARNVDVHQVNATIYGYMEFDKAVILPRWKNQTIEMNVNDDDIVLGGVVNIIPEHEINKPLPDSGKSKKEIQEKFKQIPPKELPSPELNHKQSGVLYSLSDKLRDELYGQSHSIEKSYLKV